MLKSLLQVLISKIGVLDTASSSLISGDVVVPAGVNAKENRLSSTAPFSGYAVATVKCTASVVDLRVDSKTFTQVKRYTGSFISIRLCTLCQGR